MISDSLSICDVDGKWAGIPSNILPPNSSRGKHHIADLHTQLEGVCGQLFHRLLPSVIHKKSLPFPGNAWHLTWQATVSGAIGLFVVRRLLRLPLCPRCRLKTARPLRASYDVHKIEDSLEVVKRNLADECRILEAPLGRIESHTGFGMASSASSASGRCETLRRLVQDPQPH